VLRENGVTQIKRELTPSWTFASVCAANSALCAPLPVENVLKKASLTAPVLPGSKAAKNSRITRFCPNGQPMVNGECGSTQDALRDTSLPLLNGSTTRDSSLPLPNNPLSPSTASPLGGTVCLRSIRPLAGYHFRPSGDNNSDIADIVGI